MMDYHSAIKRKGILAYGPTWVNFENVMPSDRRQTPRPHVIGFHLYVMPRIDKSTETYGRLVVARGRDKSGWQ